jgi:hypothetical protein
LSNFKKNCRILNKIAKVSKKITKIVNCFDKFIKF